MTTSTVDNPAVDIEMCLHRDRLRECRAGDDVIRNMHARWLA